jgi:hypothetical protein
MDFTPSLAKTDKEFSDIHPFGPQYIAKTSFIPCLYTFSAYWNSQGPKISNLGFGDSQFFRIESLKRYRRGYDPFL